MTKIRENLSVLSSWPKFTQTMGFKQIGGLRKDTMGNQIHSNLAACPKKFKTYQWRKKNVWLPLLKNRHDYWWGLWPTIVLQSFRMKMIMLIVFKKGAT